MKLKLEFAAKVPKVANDNEVILLKDKNIKNKIVKNLNKSIFNNKLFLEKKFVAQIINEKTYIFVNCIKKINFQTMSLLRYNIKKIYSLNYPYNHAY